MDKRLEVVLRLPPSERMVGVVNAAIEKAAGAMGLDPQGALAMTLAAEELFGYACRGSGAGMSEIACKDGGYRVVLEMELPAGALELRAINLTYRPSPGTDDQMEEMGLVLASRLADHLELTTSPSGSLRMRLSKHKLYPPLDQLPRLPEDTPPQNLSLLQPNAEQLKLLAALTCATYPPPVCMAQMCHPGKVVDMVASGDYAALVATNERGEVVGGVVWKMGGQKLVEFFGPYVFVPSAKQELSMTLVEGLISSVVRKGAVGLVCRFSPPDLPPGQFEPLGSMRLVGPDGRGSEHTAWFRLLEEDTPVTVWAHEGIREFLEENYERLVLARRIQLASTQGESMAAHSVVSTELVREQLVAVLRPLVPGQDMQQLLGEHCRVLTREGFANIFCEVDLGVAQQVLFVPALLNTGFSPRMILPFAGNKDVVLMQWEGAGI